MKDDLRTAMKGVYDEGKINFNTCETIKLIRFGDFLSEDIIPSERVYDEMTQFNRVMSKMELYLEDYN